MGASRHLFRAAKPLPDSPQLAAGAFSAARKQVMEFGRTVGCRIPAGIGAPAGVYAGVAAWWGRSHWLTVVVPAVLAADGGACRRHHVLPATVRMVARAHAAYADSRTGRTCRPTNGRLVDVASVSLSTVQRARRVLVELGLLVQVTAGRSMMTRAERLAAWRVGSSARAIAAEFALTAPRSYPHSGRPPVGRDTPPVGQGSRKLSHLSENSSWVEQPNGKGRRCAPGRFSGRLRRRGRSAPGPTRWAGLAIATKARVSWLAGTPVCRLAPLARLWDAGWTARDVDLEITAQLAERGWRVPPDLASPAAYLATLLKTADPAVRPTAREQAAIDAELARREWIWQTRIAGADCPHGQPAGDLPSPAGVVACPWCRRAAGSARGAGVVGGEDVEGSAFGQADGGGDVADGDVVAVDGGGDECVE